jgi:hypothetical protein
MYVDCREENTSKYSRKIKRLSGGGKEEVGSIVKND